MPSFFDKLLGRKPPTRPLPTGSQVLHFKSAEAAFEMECKYGSVKVKEGSVHLAAILSVYAGVEAGTSHETLLLAVADEDGPFQALAGVLPHLSMTFKENDLVAWEAVSYIDSLAKINDDPRAGWFGVVRRKLQPSYDPASGWLPMDDKVGAPASDESQSRQSSSSFEIDLKGPSPEADCLDCLVALPAAVKQMRDANDERVLPDSIIARTLEAFSQLDRRESNGIRFLAAAAQDLIYRYIAELTTLDRYTRAYFARTVRFFFSQLSIHDQRTFYILDNALRDDRLAAVIELFDLAGISVITPRRDGVEWMALSARISARLETFGHVTYIEPDGEVNHIEAAKTLARNSVCVATCRNLSIDDSQYEVVNLGAG